MYETATKDEMEYLERSLQRVFARVSVLEARVNELERTLAAQALPLEAERPRLVEPLGMTA